MLKSVGNKDKEGRELPLSAELFCGCSDPILTTEVGPSFLAETDRREATENPWMNFLRGWLPNDNPVSASTNSEVTWKTDSYLFGCFAYIRTFLFCTVRYPAVKLRGLGK